MKNLISLSIFLCSFFSYSQLENAQWRFASFSGLSFTTTPPAIVNSTINNGSCSSIADAAGNLLFYTNGFAVWNRFDMPMSGSTNPSLVGAGNSQGTLIVKKPGNNTYYYIFTSSIAGMYYSIIDMSLSAGAGSVTVKNIALTTQIQTYKIAATWNCSKSGIWITSQDNSQNSWRSYLLTATGITGPVVSTTGNTNFQNGALKFSPDGTKIASAEWNNVFLFDFNKSTGAVSGMTVVGGSGPTGSILGVEFSPNGNKLYAIKNTSLYQWDIAAGSASAIIASIYTVNTAPSNLGIFPGALQLAIDGKIYQTHNSSSLISVVNNPNVTGPSCSFSLGVFNLTPNGVAGPLPNFLKPIPPLPLISYSVSQNTCQTLIFSPLTTTINGLNSGPVNSANWIFGDPSSGPSNFSAQLNPIHIYSAPGTYTVQMIVSGLCGYSDTISQVVTVPNNAATLSFSGNSSICMGETTSLTSSGASTYTWNSSLGQLSGSAIVVNPNTSVTFTIGAQIGNSCITNSIFAVSVLPPSVFSISGQTELCVGESVTLTANGVSSYTWNSSSGAIGTASVLTTSPLAGLSNYTVQGFNPSLTCISQLFLTLTVSPYPTLSVAGPSLVCIGEAIKLTASGASSYTWNYSAGTVNASTLVTTILSPESFTVKASDPNNHCISETAFSINTNACLGISKQKMRSFCVYPNPFQDVLEIKGAQEFSWKLFNIQGRLLMADKTCHGTVSIDLSQLNTGTFILVIQSLESITYQKILKLGTP